ncbi:MAG: hypothetical protein ACE5HC_15145 [Candidatus Binatia bacterium]
MALVFAGAGALNGSLAAGLVAYRIYILPLPPPFSPSVGLLLPLCQKAGSPGGIGGFYGDPPLADLKIYQQGGGCVVARAGGGVP